MYRGNLVKLPLKQLLDSRDDLISYTPEIIHNGTQSITDHQHTQHQWGLLHLPDLPHQPDQQVLQVQRVLLVQPDLFHLVDLHKQIEIKR